MRMVILFLVLLLSNIIVCAQDQASDFPILEYNEQIRATVPVSTGEAEFQFEAVAGDIIVIEASVGINDILNGLMPEIELLNARGTEIASTSDVLGGLENLDLFSATLATEIPADGLYTILITTGEFSTLQNDAPFTLRLIQPPILQMGEEIQGEVETDFPAYYVAISNTTYTIEYRRINGGFFPAVNVARIADGSLEPVGTMYGEAMVAGSLSIEPNRNSLHLVTITTSPFDLESAFQRGEAEFIISFSN